MNRIEQAGDRKDAARQALLRRSFFRSSGLAMGSIALASLQDGAARGDDAQANRAAQVHPPLAGLP
ncbi:MAG: hypothetical protein ACKN94_10260, partial [Pirellulaceae bacterium]